MWVRVARSTFPARVDLKKVWEMNKEGAFSLQQSLQDSGNTLTVVRTHFFAFLFSQVQSNRSFLSCFSFVSPEIYAIHVRSVHYRYPVGL